jgi:transposase
VTAPDELLNRLRGLSTKELVSVVARFRLGDGPSDVPTATKFALRSVARRYEALSAEIAELDAHLDRLVAQAAPELISLPGIGTDHAAILLIVALKTTLRGWGARPPSQVFVEPHPSKPPPARSLGTASRQRWQPGRQPRAVHDLSGSDATRSAHQGVRSSRRTVEGKSKREIIRCLKRYIAREVYRVLISCDARSSPTGP